MKKTVFILMMGLLLLAIFVEASFECSSGVVNDVCDPIRLVVPTGRYIKIFEVTNTTIIENASVDLGVGYEVLGGIACYGEACYFKRTTLADGDSKPMYLDMNTLVLTAHPAVGVNSDDDIWGFTPVFVPVNPAYCGYLSGGSDVGQLAFDEGQTITLSVDGNDYEITLDDVNYNGGEVDIIIDGTDYNNMGEGPCREIVSGGGDLEICVIRIRETSAILGLSFTGSGTNAYTKDHLLVWMASDSTAGAPWKILQVIGLNFSASSPDYTYQTFAPFYGYGILDATAQIEPSIFIPFESNAEVGAILVLRPHPNYVGPENNTLIVYRVNDFCLGVEGSGEVNKRIKNLGQFGEVACLSNAVSLKCGSEQSSDLAFIYGDASEDMVAICLSKDGDVKFEMSLPDADCSDIEKDITVTEIFSDQYYDGIAMGGGVISFRDVSSNVYAFALRQINLSGIVEPLLGLTIPIDINNDGVVDFITLNNSEARYYIGTIAGEKISVGPFDVKQLSPCNIDTTFNQFGVAQIGIIGTVPEPWDPESYHYEMNFGDGTENIRHNPSDYEDPGFFVYTYNEPGNHTVTGYLCMRNGTCVENTCVVSVEANISKVDPEPIDPGECFVGNGWFFDNPSVVDICANSYGYLDFNGYPSFAMAKKSICDQRIWNWQPVIKVYADTKVDLSVRSSESAYGGTGGYAAQLKIEGGAFKVYKNNVWTTVLGNVTLNKWHSVLIEVDAQFRRVTYTLDNADEPFYEGAFPDPSVSSFYSLWKTIRYYSGDFLIDSMSAYCVQGRGGISIPYKNKIVEDFEACGMNIDILDACDSISGTKYSVAVSAGDPISSYENVYSFCSQKDVTLSSACSGDPKKDNRLCDYEDLKNIVNIKPRCTAEVMNYCVDTLYTLKSGGESSDGVVVCSATLGFGVGIDKVTTPIITYMYKIFIGNITEILILVVSLIIIFTIIGLKKKG